MILQKLTDRSGYAAGMNLLSRFVPVLFFVFVVFAIKAGVGAEGCRKSSLFPLRVNHLSIAFPGVRLSGITLKTSVEKGKGCAWVYNIEKARVKKLRFKCWGRWIELNNVSIEGSIQGSQSGSLDGRLTAIIPRMGKIVLKAVREQDNEVFRAIVDLNSLDIFPIVAQLTGGKLVQGKIPLSLAIRLISRSDGIAYSVNGKIAGALWEDEPFDYAGDDVRITLHIEGRTERKGKKWLVSKGDFDILGGDVIFSGLMLDFGITPLKSRFSGVWNLATARFRLTFFTADLLDLIKIRAEGDSASEFEWSMQLTSLARFYDLIVKESMHDSIFSDAGFRLSGKCKSFGRFFVATEKSGICGHLMCDELNMHSESPSFKGEFVFDIPFFLSLFRTSITSPEIKCPSKGFFTAKYLDFYDLHLDRIDIEVLSDLNEWTLRKPIDIHVLNGVLVLNNASLKLSPRLKGNISISTKKPLKYNIRPFPVHLKTSGITWTFDGANLRSRGSLLLAAFSGTVEVERLDVEDVFSPSRSFLIDARWDNIDLKKLSSISSFGLIRGKLAGYVRSLRIAYGMPIDFDLVLWSKPSKDQIISITAVENITRLGSAASPFQGVAGAVIKTFFKEFPYDRIGIRCVLHNDRFSIQGLIKEKGREYLVKRRGLRGVDVVNIRSPNVISWSEMVKRLKRVKEADKPIVK